MSWNRLAFLNVLSPYVAASLNLLVDGYVLLPTEMYLKINMFMSCSTKRVCSVSEKTRIILHTLY